MSRRSDLRPLGNGRSHKLLLAVCLGVVVLVLGGGGALWAISQSQAGGRVPVAPGGEIARITPVAPASNAPATVATPVAPAMPEFHVVQAGEVLSAIAKKYNTTVEALAELNNIDDVDAIRVGQRLRLVPAEQ